MQDYEQFVGRKTSFRIFNRPVSRERYAASNETTLTMLRDNGDIRSWSRAVKDQMPSRYVPNILSLLLTFQLSVLCRISSIRAHSGLTLGKLHMYCISDGYTQQGRNFLL